jgi:hypothetical protein
VAVAAAVVEVANNDYDREMAGAGPQACRRSGPSQIQIRPVEPS